MLQYLFVMTKTISLTLVIIPNPKKRKRFQSLVTCCNSKCGLILQAPQFSRISLTLSEMKQKRQWVLSVYSAGNQIVLKRTKSMNGLFPSCQEQLQSDFMLCTVTECDKPTLSPLNSVTNTFAFLLLLHNKGHR